MNGDSVHVLHNPSLEISSPEHLRGIVQDVTSNETIARRIEAIEILSHEDQENQEEEEDDQKSRDQALHFCEDLVSLIEAVVRQGSLRSFKWPSSSLDNIRFKRPEMFWQALSKAAPTLSHLNLGFYVHEIHDLGDLNPFPVAFEELKSLTLGMSDSHGDDASMIDRMLQKIHKLELFILDLPMCDLESCRVQGLTYNYNFPSVKAFEISAYLDANIGFSTFLSRHPSITSLNINIESDEPLRIPRTMLPNLRSLSLGSFGQDPDLLQADLLSASAGRPITHMRIGRGFGISCTSLAIVAPTLRCLEIDTTSWREERIQQSVAQLLPHLTALEELDVAFCSGNLSYHDDETGGWRDADALSTDDLCKLLSYLPLDSRIRALKMTDDRSAPLPATFLANLPPVPRNLSFLGWKAGGKEVLYMLQQQQDGDSTVAVQCERLRGVVDETGAPWTEGSILSHLG